MEDKLKPVDRALVVDVLIEETLRKGYCRVELSSIAAATQTNLSELRQYYPNKSDLLVAFYQDRAEKALIAFIGTADFSNFTFEEKFQLLIDTYLEHLSGDRAFVEATVDVMKLMPFALKKLRDKIFHIYGKEMQIILQQARDEADLPPLPLSKLAARICTDYVFYVIHYWAKDRSQSYEATTKFVELCVDLLSSHLKSGVDVKMTALLRFGTQLKLRDYRGKLEGYLPGYTGVKQFFDETFDGTPK